jgi:exonuclease SbcC
MIEYDYLMERDEGDEKREFKPGKIPKKLDNITYIEGPNSSGKSTLLNIVALGFYGLRNTTLNPELTYKIAKLSSSHQKIRFHIKIKSKNESFQLISEKSNLNKPEIVVKEIVNKKEAILSKELFERKYNLIYDIPDNPTQRLQQLVLDIKDLQIQYSHRIGSLKAYVKEIITAIKNARDPERVTDLQNQLKECLTEKESAESTLEEFKKQRDALEDYTYHRLYMDYKDKIRQIKDRIFELERKSHITEKKNRIENKEYSVLIEDVKGRIKEMEVKFNEVTVLLNAALDTNNKHLLKIWEKIDLSKALQEFNFEEEFESLIIQFKNILSEQITAMEGEDSTKEAGLYNDLLEVLENYKNTKINIPGLEKNITEFMNDLKKAAAKYESKTNLKKNCEQADADLAILRRSMEYLNRGIFPELKKLKLTKSYNFSDYIEDTAEKEIEDLKKQLGILQGKYEEYDSKYSSRGKPDESKIKSHLGIKIKEYERYTEDQLREKIKMYNKSINEENIKFKEREHTETIVTSELERLKNKKPHKYQNNLETLNHLFNKLNTMEAKFLDYRKFIEAIKDRNLPEKISQEQKTYTESIFEFLAQRVGKLRHIEREYTPIKIDIVNGIIYTQEKKNIHLSDMGTGQSQSAYLKGLLNTSDKRKMIVMFDEIAMMDSHSLEPIYKKLRELYEEGKLIMAIVVQRGEDVNVVSRTGD